MLDQFRKATPASQGKIVLGIVAILAIALTLLWIFVMHVAYAPIFTHMPATEAAAIVAELDKQKIPYQLSDGGRTISVPEDKADTTRLGLLKSNLSLKDVVGFELFNKTDMGITEFAQKINYQRALQGELERTIAGLDGVETARVHLSMGNDRLFREDRVAPKASITLHMVNGARVPPTTVEGVQELVSAAVPQLDPSAVVVLDEGGQVLRSTYGEPGLTPRVAQKRAVEQYYEARIRDALNRSFSIDSIQVSVWIDRLTPEQTPVSMPADADRTFRMQVTLAPENPMQPDEQANMRSIAAEAIGYRAALGDAIVLGAPQQATASRMVEPVVRVADNSADDISQATTEMRSDGGMILPIVAAGVAIGAALLLVVRRLRSAPLDERGKAAFAEKLRTMIDEEEEANGRTTA